MPDFIFRLPPIERLTLSQRIAYSEREKSLLVTGGPGSGKTVVSIYRFIRGLNEEQKTIFYTYHRTLIASIKGTFRQQAEILMPQVSEDNIETLLDKTVGSFSEWYYRTFYQGLPNQTDEEISNNLRLLAEKMHELYDEILVDEAQDLKPVILDGVIDLANKMTCGADRAQDLQGHYIEPADDYILEILEAHDKVVLPQGLTRNFRNTKQIFEFARRFVEEDLTVQSIDLTGLENGDKPEVYKLSEVQQFELIETIIADNPNSNIGILVHTGPQVMSIKNFLESKGYSCAANSSDDKSFSYYHFTMPHSDRYAMEKRLRTPFILTFESCKGLEFDIVIMPFFEKSDWAMATSKKTQDGELDKMANGEPKLYATDNHYYVAATRARRLLYIFYTQKPKVLNFYNEND